jgi:hypothetical protein
MRVLRASSLHISLWALFLSLSCPWQDHLLIGPPGVFCLMAEDATLDEHELAFLKRRLADTPDEAVKALSLPQGEALSSPSSPASYAALTSPPLDSPASFSEGINSVEVTPPSGPIEDHTLQAPGQPVRGVPRLSHTLGLAENGRSGCTGMAPASSASRRQPLPPTDRYATGDESICFAVSASWVIDSLKQSVATVAGWTDLSASFPRLCCRHAHERCGECSWSPTIPLLRQTLAVGRSRARVCWG